MVMKPQPNVTSTNPFTKTKVTDSIQQLTMNSHSENFKVMHQLISPPRHLKEEGTSDSRLASPDLKQQPSLNRGPVDSSGMMEDEIKTSRIHQNRTSQGCNRTRMSLYCCPKSSSFMTMTLSWICYLTQVISCAGSSYSLTNYTSGSGYYRAANGPITQLTTSLFSPLIEIDLILPVRLYCSYSGPMLSNIDNGPVIGFSSQGCRFQSLYGRVVDGRDKRAKPAANSKLPPCLSPCTDGDGGGPGGGGSGNRDVGLHTLARLCHSSSQPTTTVCGEHGSSLAFGCYKDDNEGYSDVDSELPCMDAEGAKSGGGGSSKGNPGVQSSAQGCHGSSQPTTNPTVGAGHFSSSASGGGCGGDKPPNNGRPRNYGCEHYLNVTLESACMDDGEGGGCGNENPESQTSAQRCHGSSQPTTNPLGDGHGSSSDFGSGRGGGSDEHYSGNGDSTSRPYNDNSSLDLPKIFQPEGEELAQLSDEREVMQHIPLDQRISTLGSFLWTMVRSLATGSAPSSWEDDGLTTRKNRLEDGEVLSNTDRQDLKKVTFWDRGKHKNYSFPHGLEFLLASNGTSGIYSDCWVNLTRGIVVEEPNQRTEVSQDAKNPRVHSHGNHRRNVNVCPDSGSSLLQQVTHLGIGDGQRSSDAGTAADSGTSPQPPFSDVITESPDLAGNIIRGAEAGEDSLVPLPPAGNMTEHLRAADNDISTPNVREPELTAEVCMQHARVHGNVDEIVSSVPPHQAPTWDLLAECPSTTIRIASSNLSEDSVTPVPPCGDIEHTDDHSQQGTRGTRGSVVSSQQETSSDRGRFRLLTLAQERCIRSTLPGTAHAFSETCVGRPDARLRPNRAFTDPDRVFEHPPGLYTWRDDSNRVARVFLHPPGLYTSRNDMNRTGRMFEHPPGDYGLVFWWPFFLAFHSASSL